MRKLKIRFGKYRGKLPLKCFNCGKIKHFDAKCPYAKCEENDDEEEHENRSKSYIHRRGKYSKKNGFYSKEDNISLKDNDKCASNINKEEIRFIATDAYIVDKEDEYN